MFYEFQVVLEELSSCLHIILFVSVAVEVLVASHCAKVTSEVLVALPLCIQSHSEGFGGCCDRPTLFPSTSSLFPLLYFGPSSLLFYLMFYLVSASWTTFATLTPHSATRLCHEASFTYFLSSPDLSRCCGLLIYAYFLGCYLSILLRMTDRTLLISFPFHYKSLGSLARIPQLDLN